MDTHNNYKLYVERTVIGTRLSLYNDSVINSKYVRWAVEDDLNGSSIPTEILTTPTKDGRITDYIYGFYKASNEKTVTLKFYMKNGKLDEKEGVIEGVTILQRKKEVNANV